MKSAILVAAIATATMLTACGSKSDSSNGSPLAAAVSDKVQADLGNGTWLSECRTRVTSPSTVGAGSEQVRIEFTGASLLDVTPIVFKSDDCSGDSKSGEKENLILESKGTKSGMKALVYTGKMKRDNYSMTVEKADLIDTVKISVVDANTLSIKGLSSLAGTFTRETQIERADDQKYGDYGVDKYNEANKPWYKKLF